MCTKVYILFYLAIPLGIFIFMTVYNALLINISTNSESFLRCTFCQNRDKFFINIPTNYFTEIFEGQYYNVDFDILCDNFGNQFSFNFINPAKDTSHD